MSRTEPLTTSGAAPLIVDGFRRVRRSTFTEGATMEGAEYHRHSRARMAETAKDASRHPAPDAPERIDDRRRCTGHAHRTCCRGSRPYRATRLRKRVEIGHAGSHRRPILNTTTSPGVVRTPQKSALIFSQLDGSLLLGSNRICGNIGDGLIWTGTIQIGLTLACGLDLEEKRSITSLAYGDAAPAWVASFTSSRRPVLTL